ncbi:MAG: WecB/TagA/CpsF family glycosyltransferase [Patescibacteria group bacterium]
MSKIKILDIKIDNFKSDQVTEKLDTFILQKKPVLICTPNTEFIVSAQEDGYFKEILNDTSSLNLPDGFGLLWAARFNTLPTPEISFIREATIIIEWILSILLIPLLPSFFKNPLEERVTGADFTRKIAKFAANNKLRMFLLGGAPTVAERTALQLQTEIPGLKISGVYSGKAEETNQMLEAINKSRTDILLVAFGAPKQEKWLAENLNKTKCKIGIGVGGSFDFIAGVKKRAPKWMQKSGLEWLYRLIKEPIRIKRQMALPKFLWLILINRLKRNN